MFILCNLFDPTRTEVRRDRSVGGEAVIVRNFHNAANPKTVTLSRGSYRTLL